MAEGARWAEAALACSADLPTPLRARVLGAAGELLAWGRGDHTHALGLHHEALALFRSLDDAANVGHMLVGLGVELAMAGDFAQGRRALEEAVAVFRALDEPWGTGWALVDLAWVVRQAGGRAEAQALTEEGLAQVRRSGDFLLVIQALTALGGLVLEAGEVTRAATLAREGLALLHDSGVRWCLPEALELAGGLAGARRRGEAAARLFGAADAAREVTGAGRFIGRAAYEEFVAKARAGIEEQAFAAAWTEGRSLSAEQAIEQGLESLQHVPADTLEASKLASPHPPDALTPRECEVAALIARGLSNRQIAKELVVAEGTVALHVHHILDKLGCSSRTQVAVWAAAQGLLAET
jgi:non-specific serine/threonine protein kinase